MNDVAGGRVCHVWDIVRDEFLGDNYFVSGLRKLKSNSKNLKKPKNVKTLKNLRFSTPALVQIVSVIFQSISI